MGKIRDAISNAHQTMQAYRTIARGYYFASIPLVVVVLLTHFSFGFTSIADHVAYADAICLAGIGTAAGILICKDRLASTCARQRIVLAATGAASVMFLLMQVNALPFDSIVVTVSAMATGAYIAIASALWFDCFIGKPIEIVLLSLALCLMGGCALSWFLLGMAPSRFTVGYLLSLVASGGLLALALKSSDEEGQRSDQASEHPAPSNRNGSLRTSLALLISVFALCFTAMLSLAFAGRQQWHSDKIWLVLVPAALIVLIVALFSKKAQAGMLLQIALILAVASLLLSTFSTVSPALLLIASSSGMAVTLSLSIVFMLELARQSKCDPHIAGSRSVVTVFAGCLAGRYAAELIMGSPDSAPFKTAVSIALVIALIICILMSLSSESIGNIARIRLKKERKQGNHGDDQDALASFADRKGLGAREYEALCLLLEGCSAREVAQRMFVADGTAKAHIRHIYQKLDIHDREALFATVEKEARKHQG